MVATYRLKNCQQQLFAPKKCYPTLSRGICENSHMMEMCKFRSFTQFSKVEYHSKIRWLELPESGEVNGSAVLPSSAIKHIILIAVSEDNEDQSIGWFNYGLPCAKLRFCKCFCFYYVKIKKFWCKFDVVEAATLLLPYLQTWTDFRSKPHQRRKMTRIGNGILTIWNEENEYGMTVIDE